MQVLPVIVPYIKTTSNLALSCKGVWVWLSNNGFAIKTGKRNLCLDNLSFYKFLEYPELDEWTFGVLCDAFNNNDNYNRLNLLLDRGANIEAKNVNGWTALTEAVWLGNVDCLNLLLQHKANIEAKNHTGKTALYWAAYYRQPECLKILVENGAKVEPWVRESYPQYAEVWGDSTL